MERRGKMGVKAGGGRRSERRVTDFKVGLKYSVV